MSRLRLGRRRVLDHWLFRVPWPCATARVMDAELVIIDGRVVKHRVPLEGTVIVVSSRGHVTYERGLS